MYSLNFHKYKVDIYLWNDGKKLVQVYGLSPIVSISKWVLIRRIAACAPSDAKLLEGGVFAASIYTFIHKIKHLLLIDTDTDVYMYVWVCVYVYVIAL